MNKERLIALSLVGACTGFLAYMAWDSHKTQRLQQDYFSRLITYHDEMVEVVRLDSLERRFNDEA